MGDETSPLFESVFEGGIAAAHPALSSHPLLVAPTTSATFNTFAAATVSVACLKLEDAKFGFDSSFIVPEARAAFQALSHMLTLHKDKTSSKPPPLSIFGHADPTGNDEYNKALSGRRAAAVYATLTRKTELWEDLFSNKGMFTQVALGDQWGDAAIASMRTALNLGDRGKSTPAQRQALFLAYMDFLCVDNALASYQVEPKEGFLGQQQDPLGKGDYQGCGEFNPVLLVSRTDKQKFDKQKDTTERNHANAPNRRVMVLLFRPGSTTTASLWPCPRAKEGSATCRKRFWSDGEKRRSIQEDRREFKDKQDTFACRFYQRLVTHSPCEKGDKNTFPLVLALFDTHSEERDSQMQLLVFDGSDQEVQSIPGEKAADNQNGLFLYRIHPAELPDPVRLEWHTRDGNRHLAGPCSPSELRNALVDLDLDKGHALVGEPRKGAQPEPVPTPQSDDVLVNIITEGADGDLA